MEISGNKVYGRGPLSEPATQEKGGDKASSGKEDGKRIGLNTD